MGVWIRTIGTKEARQPRTEKKRRERKPSKEARGVAAQLVPPRNPRSLRPRKHVRPSFPSCVDPNTNTNIGRHSRNSREPFSKKKKLPKINPRREISRILMFMTRCVHCGRRLDLVQREIIASISKRGLFVSARFKASLSLPSYFPGTKVKDGAQIALGSVKKLFSFLFFYILPLDLTYSDAQIVAEGKVKFLFV